MPTLKLPLNHDQSPFFRDITEEGYHVFSRENVKVSGYYPDEFPDYPGVKIKDLKIDDQITVRVFFRVGSGEDIRADGGYIDLEVEAIAEDSVIAVIRTELPAEFALGAGDSIEIYEEEILYMTGEWER